MIWRRVSKYTVPKKNTHAPDSRWNNLYSCQTMPHHVVQACNAPTGVKGQTLAKGIRLLGKSTGGYGKPKVTRVSLVRRWTSKLGRCLTRQSKRSCSEATTEKAISDRPSTGLRTRGSTRNNEVEVNEMNGVL